MLTCMQLVTTVCLSGGAELVKNCVHLSYSSAAVHVTTFKVKVKWAIFSVRSRTFSYSFSPETVTMFCVRAVTTVSILHFLGLSTTFSQLHSRSMEKEELEKSASAPAALWPTHFTFLSSSSGEAEKGPTPPHEGPGAASQRLYHLTNLSLYVHLHPRA